ncbi:uncharacterized protein [Aegilops tauschii subsp. strangulata]|uniref:uncharacterized protein n=1 Tax=Aegilops tauschii subsp. strangulata TaxID=200361 RepID=UPI003CC8BA50
MPFGLKNASTTFMRMIQKCLLTQISRNVEEYMDDIVVKSGKSSDLLTDLAETFANLRRFDIKLNLSKCTFGVLGGKLLSFLISEQGIDANPEKTGAILRMIRPALPLYRPMKKSDTFEWTIEAEAAVVLVSPRGDKLSYFLKIHFDSYHNEVEYEALLYGLRMAILLGIRRLMVYDDSDLVVNQVMKEWDVRSPAMIGYCNAVRKLEKKFEGLELHHVPRLKNQAADDLAKIGSTRKPIPSNVFLEHLHTPSVQEDPFTEEPPQPISSTNSTEVEVPAIVDLIMEILVITPDWTMPYIAYLLRQELPEDEVEASQIVRRSKPFMVIGGHLYRESVTSVAQRCISPEEGRLILNEIHSRTYGHHASSWTIVAKACRARFYWPRANEAAKEIVEKCEGC